MPYLAHLGAAPAGHAAAQPAPAAHRGLRLSSLAAGAAALAALAAQPAAAQSWPVYSVTPLPAISSFTAFNDSGLVLGRGFVPCSGICTQSDVAVLYDTRTAALTALGSGFGVGPQFDTINAKGQLAGGSLTYDGITGTWVRSVVVRQVDGSITTLPTPALSAAQNAPVRARGFNAAGQIVLEHTDGLDGPMPMCGNYQAWTGTGASTASWQALGPAANVVRPTGINASGVAVGATVPAASCGGMGYGFRAMAASASGVMVDLHGSMPGVFSRANGINDLGYAVGDYDTGARTAPDANNPQGQPIVHAAVWNTASRNWLDLGPAGTASRLNAVNNRGEVVGSANAGTMTAGQAYTPSGTRAILGNLATPWPVVDLNTLLANNTGGWVLQDAVAINTSGQIVARGASPTVGSGYVLLTPVSAPVNPYATVPAAPASLAASGVTASAATLTWTVSARNATRVVVERCRGNGCTGYVAIATLTGDATRFSDGGLVRRTTYRWRVRTGNAAGLSASSNVVTATTLR